jgi:hypothetical protein
LSTEELEAVRADLADAAAALHLVGDAAELRGDHDVRRALRLVARTLESVEERLEQHESKETT